MSQRLQISDLNLLSVTEKLMCNTHGTLVALNSFKQRLIFYDAAVRQSETKR